jgi:hypothetical protein
MKYLEAGVRRINVFTDSMIIVNYLPPSIAHKSKQQSRSITDHFKPLWSCVLELAAKFDLIRVNHTSGHASITYGRHGNPADHLAKLGSGVDAPTAASPRRPTEHYNDRTFFTLLRHLSTGGTQYREYALRARGLTAHASVLSEEARSTVPRKYAARPSTY